MKGRQERKETVTVAVPVSSASWHSPLPKEGDTRQTSKAEGQS